MKFKVIVKGYNSQTGKRDTKFIELTERELDKSYAEGAYSPTLALRLGLLNAYIDDAELIE